MQLQKKIANIWRIERGGISAIKFEAARLDDNWLRFSKPLPSLLLKLSNIVDNANNVSLFAMELDKQDHDGNGLENVA